MSRPGNQLYIRSLFLTLSAFLAGAVFFCNVYETNDDTLANCIAAGSFTGTGSPFTLFNHYFFGVVLRELYAFPFQLNWYFFCLLALYLCSILLLSAIYLKLRPAFVTHVFFIAIFLLSGYRAFVEMQYTFIAFAASCSAVLSLCLFYAGNKIPRRYVLYAFGVFFAASCIRWQAAGGALLLMSPLWLYLVFRQISIRKGLLWGSFIMLLPLLILSNRLFYEQADPGFIDYEHAAYKMLNHDYPVSDQGLREIGWSRNDYDLFKVYFWADPAVFSKEDIVQLASSVHISPDWKAGWQTCRDLAKQKNWITWSVLLFFLYCIFFTDGPHKSLQLGLFCLAVLLPVLLASYSKLPARIFDSTAMCYLCTAYFMRLAFPYEDKTAHRIAASLFLPILFFFCFMQVREYAATSSENVRGTRSFQGDVSFVNDHPETLFVDVMCGYPFNGFALPGRAPQFSAGNFLYCAGFIYSPAFDRVLEQKHIDDLSADLKTAGPVVFIDSYQPFFDMYLAFLKAHYDIKASFSPYPELPDARALVMEDASPSEDLPDPGPH